MSSNSNFQTLHLLSGLESMYLLIYIVPGIGLYDLRTYAVKNSVHAASQGFLPSSRNRTLSYLAQIGHILSSSLRLVVVRLRNLEACSDSFDVRIYIIYQPTILGGREAFHAYIYIHTLGKPDSTEHIYYAQFCDCQLRRFNLVSFDLRGGHGGTTGDRVPFRYGQVEAAEDTMRLMDAIKLPPCHLVAMSSGTTIAVEIAVTQPERVLSMFLISHLCLEIPLEVAEGHEEVNEIWASAFPDESTVKEDAIYDAGFGNIQYMFSNPKLSPLVTAMTRVTYPVAMVRWNYHHLDQFRIMNLDFYLNRKSHPKSVLARIIGSVKLVHGSEDVAYPKSYAEEFLRQLEEAGVEASLLEVPGAPHYLSPDFAACINPVLHKFILQNDRFDLALCAPIPDHVVSPWEDKMRQAGLNPDGAEDADSSSDDGIIINSCLPSYLVETLDFL
ncbi:alpha beta hydrolase fold protein [Lentinula edodes]|uniref:Alpha beta hydrolase fold protein n=1 Tax=Lentinula edodes TaxID=5353 RepID=A0A1Q3E7A6_LENED|nr:alpha beta hydrolase fold protein [Lentinula edodes]